MKKYTFYWLSGQREVLEGNDPADAMNRAGYGHGAIPALDFYQSGDDNSYEWKEVDGKKRWVKVRVSAKSISPEIVRYIDKCIKKGTSCLTGKPETVYHDSESYQQDNEYTNPEAER